jgi:hypothetical protein
LGAKNSLDEISSQDKDDDLENDLSGFWIIVEHLG